MSFKSIVRELKEMRDGIGSRSRKGGGGPDPSQQQQLVMLQRYHQRRQGRWAELPTELLRDVIERMEAAEEAWPARRDVVACASVCRSWRETTKEIVRTPEECARITFPISLKQPGPRDSPIQCFIKRERTTGIFRLYLGLSPALQGENGKLLLAACKIRRATNTDYMISLVPNDFSRASSTYEFHADQISLGPSSLYMTTSLLLMSKSFQKIALSRGSTLGKCPQECLVEIITLPLSATNSMSSEPGVQEGCSAQCCPFQIQQFRRVELLLHPLPSLTPWRTSSLFYLFQCVMIKNWISLLQASQKN
ncbi:tubby-like F-box protein 5 [Iris pallida]|uniref:Tubby-like F-box protein 5 n=1 Tax=Iris pallida TaxID=29817 RepID=A0AAX6HAV6_IRIPA|nr:tubby-like F-box protein 5 [Iris pallida]